jgi:hypothetical protein
MPAILALAEREIDPVRDDDRPEALGDFLEGEDGGHMRLNHRQSSRTVILVSHESLDRLDWPMR